MTDQQELRCPDCGARIYATDSQCVSCGVRLDERQPVHEPRREAAPAPRRAETQYEQRARPSRWPVYLAAVPIGLVGFYALSDAMRSMWGGGGGVLSIAVAVLFAWSGILDLGWLSITSYT